MSSVETVIYPIGGHPVDTMRALLREYAAAIETDLEYQGFSAELAGLPAPYAKPGGAFVIAYDDTEAVGCAGLKRIDDRIGEMKRLYLRPAYRGKGLGKRLVEAVEHAAYHAGYFELCLDTLATMTSAQALYRRMGFVEIPPYGRTFRDGTCFFARSLSHDILTRSDGDGDFWPRYEIGRHEWLDGPHSGHLAFDRWSGERVLFHTPYERGAGLLQERLLEAFDRKIHDRTPSGQLWTLPVRDHGIVDDGRPFFTEPFVTDRPAHVLSYPDMYHFGVQELWQRLEERRNEPLYEPDERLRPPTEDEMMVYGAGDTDVKRVHDGGTYLWCRFADALYLFDEHRPGAMILGRMRDLAACGVGLSTFIKQFVSGRHAWKIDLPTIQAPAGR